MNEIKITIDDLFELPDAAVYNSDNYKPASSVSIDSRNIKNNSLFVAINGEKFDGHDYVCEAIKRGASAVIINENKADKINFPDVPYITVKDTSIALGDLAKVWRSKLNTKIIGITGSAGKTTTKEMLAVIMSERFKLNKTLGNNNNHIGVPLTLFSTLPEHEFLILELGTNHFGEIAYTAKIANPNYGLITNIGNSHLEFLKNKKGVLTEKIALFDVVAAKAGIVFINNDDTLLSKTELNYPKRVTFGFESSSDVKGEIIKFDDTGKPVIAITYRDIKIQASFPVYGEQNAKNYLAAAAIALKLGLTKAEILSGIAKFKPFEQRLNFESFKKFILIDDSYNANPESMKYAIELMPKVKAYKKKMVILGDMFELGAEGPKFHSELARIVKRNKIDITICTGELMKYLDAELKKLGKESIHFDDRKELSEYLKSFKYSGYVVLIKGSRGMHMEEFSKIIEAKAHD